jgi:hypothetical protein
MKNKKNNSVGRRANHLGAMHAPSLKPYFIVFFHRLLSISFNHLSSPPLAPSPLSPLSLVHSGLRILGTRDALDSGHAALHHPSRQDKELLSRDLLMQDIYQHYRASCIIFCLPMARYKTLPF